MHVKIFFSKSLVISEKTTQSCTLHVVVVVFSKHIKKHE